MEVQIVVEQLRRSVPGGIGTYVSGLLQGLAELNDHEVHVTGLASRGATPEPLRRSGVDLRCTRAGHRLQMAAWDVGLGRVDGTGILHLTSLAGPTARPGGPVRTVMVHDLAWRRNPELTTQRGRRWHDAALRRALESTAHLVTPSEEVAMQLEALDVPSERLHVIGEGADHLPAPDHDEARSSLARAGVEGSFLLTVSTLEPRKNLEHLLAAHQMAGLSAGHVADLVVVGPAGWGEDLTPVPGVHLLGQVSSPVLAALLASCAGFVYVPISEGFGLPPLEAMGHGAPVLASTTTPSMVDAPVVARVEPRDVDGLVAGLLELSRGRAALGAASQAGLDFAARHRWVDVAAAHVALWKALQ